MFRHQPAPPLQPFVDCLWLNERGALTHTRERGLPTGCADIVIPLLQDDILRYEHEDDAAARRLRGAVVQGPHDRFSLRGTEGPSSVVGVHFRPGGAAALFGGALPELRNLTVLLEDLWGLSARDLRESLQDAPTPAARLQRLEAHLMRRLRGAQVPDPMVASVLDAWQRDPAQARVEPAQRASGCTPAQFIRRFEAAVGLTPKRYARVLRFNALLPMLVRQGPRDWAEVAVASGYFDQSHLIHEFRRLGGMTPAAYVPIQPDRPTHVALL
ncbi:AraC family transcriptional regulator [Piscinibacter sp.]|uniref:AraC family transcriptional regulator n=1 Tax=Piscinibacter sp. TaxID=1903157 RepID=UPI002B82B7B0|nr:helix-turn-helix domain-containing protein [Albitalea sp.]HUG25207.1 helix-turn-helix domain-containing protein [Albitalea sp.]